jgi:hypothetical protein
MGGTPPYTASLVLTNPDGGQARGSFTVSSADNFPVDVRIHSISPQIVPLDEPIWLTVRGTGFAQGLTVKVNGFDIAPVGVEYRSSEEILVSVRMGGTPPYTARLVVTNSDRSAAEGTFHVAAGSGTPPPPGPSSGTAISISSVSPAEVIGGQPATLTVRGSGFTSGIRASLQSMVWGIETTTFVNANEVRLGVRMVTGSYTATLVLTNPDGAEARSTFRVREATQPGPLSIQSIGPQHVPVNWLRAGVDGDSKRVRDRASGNRVSLHRRNPGLGPHGRTATLHRAAGCPKSRFRHG